MLTRSLWLAGLLAAGGLAATTDTSIESDTRGVVTLSGTQDVSSSTSSNSRATYKSVSGQITASDLYASTTETSSSRSRSGSGSATSTATGTGTNGDSTASTTTSSTSRGSTSTITLLVGGEGIVTESVINGTVTLTASHNATATTTTGTGSSTSTSAAATNTQPCNGYPEFCARKYGNITEVCAHNSAFDISGNAASNQKYDITTQLNDGIRMIQGETQWVNNTIYSCHTSCDLLNAGTWLDELKQVASWLEENPYDVVTILIGNSDYVDVGNYTAPLQDSGLGPYLYEPPYIPMQLDQWPTLSEMILTQKRVVVFMDYQADQTTVPYILDEFTHMWETPFSPTNVSFPCTQERPPGLNQTVAREDMLYMANHNLNTEVSLLGFDLLLPNTAALNVTNAAGYSEGELGAMAGNCTADWGRPPNFLLVDYYNVGDGSVFEVAAKYNNVTYTGTCCGSTTSAATDIKVSALALLVSLAAVFVLNY